MAYAEELGYRIKLIGLAKKVNQDIEVRVHPTLIYETQLVANVDGPMNAKYWVCPPVSCSAS